MFDFLSAQLRDYRLVAKYIVSGGIAAASQLGMLIFLVERFHVGHLAAVVYAFVFSALIAFGLQKFWTFRDRSMSKAHFQVALYLALVLVALLLNVLLMYVFVDIFRLWYVAAQVVTIGLVTIVTFLCNKNIIFSGKGVSFLSESRLAGFVVRHKMECAVFALAVFARLIFFFICLHANGGDLIATIRGQDGYFQLSKNLLLGNGFSIDSAQPFLPYSYGVPGYPFFMYALLWLTGSYAATIMVQLLLGAAIPLIGMYLTRTVLLPSFKRAPLVVGVLLALAPYQVLFSFIFYTETVFTVVFGVFLIVFLNLLKTPSTRLAIVSGLLLGVATLIKPTVEYLPLVAIGFVLWHFRDRLNRALALKMAYFLAVFLVVLSPWLYRNYTTFGIVNLSAQMPFNLYETLLPSVLAIANHSDFATEQKALPLSLDASLSEMSVAAKQAVVAISHHPTALIELSALNAFTFFTHDGMLTFLQAAGVSPSSYLQKPALLLLISAPGQFAGMVWSYMHTDMAAIFFARLFWIAVTIFFFLGLYRLFRAKLFSPELVFLSIIVFYFMLTTMINGLAVNARFRMPVEPIIFAVAYAGLVLTGASVSKRISI